MFADLVLVLSELSKLDPEADYDFETDESVNGIHIFSEDHEKFDVKHLSREALEAMVRHNWRYSKGNISHYYFEY